MALRISLAPNYSNTIWEETFWFPENLNYGWKDIKNDPVVPIYLPQFSDLRPAFLFGIVLVYVRYLLERHFFIPMGMRYGILEKRSAMVMSNAKLEAVYSANTLPRHDLIKTLSKETDMTRRQTETWLRRRFNMDEPVPLLKFGESCWQMSCYSFLLIFGIILLWGQPFFGETMFCWKGWPNQHVPVDLFDYYFLELGCYCCLFITLFGVTKRKNFKLMAIHHITTIILICFSWLLNYVRIGCLVMFVHNPADIFLHLTKMFIYCKKDRARDISFVIFVAVWIITRLIIYPYVILYSTTVEVFIAGITTMNHGAYIFFNFFLYLLQGLHIIWSYKIFRIVHRKLKKGFFEVARSDDEDSENEL